MRFIYGLSILAVALTAGATPTTKQGSSSPTLKWVGCPSPFPGHFKCSKILVPVSYDRPDGRHIDLNVAMIPAKNPSKRIGSWVYQEGGPGFSTMNDSIGYDNVLGWQKMQQYYDVVTIDPRGVGYNYPIRCDPKQADLAIGTVRYPKTKQEWEKYRDLYGTIGDRCKKLTEEAYGADIWPTFDTLTSARDLESLRVALNEGGLNYYGLSWGKYDLSAIFSRADDFFQAPSVGNSTHESTPRILDAWFLMPWWTEHSGSNSSTCPKL
jgi:pimeloyl-ACP methyl ester carboxylesterase